MDSLWFKLCNMVENSVRYGLHIDVFGATCRKASVDGTRFHHTDVYAERSDFAPARKCKALECRLAGYVTTAKREWETPQHGSHHRDTSLARSAHCRQELLCQLNLPQNIELEQAGQSIVGSSSSARLAFACVVDKHCRSATTQDFCSKAVYGTSILQVQREVFDIG